MISLVCTEPYHLNYSETDEPFLSDNHTILKVKRIGICGTDLHAYQGNQPFFNYPRILGHELAAEIVETTSNDFIKGEAVSVIPYFNCGICIACKNNKPNCCEKINVFGVHIDGGFRECIAVPNDSLVHGNGLSFDELALIEPLAIGAHAINHAQIKAEEFVLVVGTGPIGLGIASFAKIAGAKVIVMDINQARLKFCMDTLQVQFIINAATDNIVETLHAITNGNMPTCVIDATGSLKAINNSFNYIAHGGKYILVGLQKENISFSHPEFHKREATLMSSRNATKSDFEHVMKCMNNKLINTSNYITHRVKFNAVKENFEAWINPANGVIKAMVEI